MRSSQIFLVCIFFFISLLWVPVRSMGHGHGHGGGHGHGHSGGHAHGHDGGQGHKGGQSPQPRAVAPDQMGNETMDSSGEIDLSSNSTNPNSTIHVPPSWFGNSGCSYSNWSPLQTVQYGIFPGFLILCGFPGY